MEALLILLFSILVYLLPSIIAYKRNHASKHSILFWNITTGWMFFIPWIICLGWALGNKGANQTVIVNNNLVGGYHGSDNQRD